MPTPNVRLDSDLFRARHAFRERLASGPRPSQRCRGAAGHRVPFAKASWPDVGANAARSGHPSLFGILIQAALKVRDLVFRAAALSDEVRPRQVRRFLRIRGGRSHPALPRSPRTRGPRTRAKVKSQIMDALSSGQHQRKVRVLSVLVQRTRIWAAGWVNAFFSGVTSVPLERRTSVRSRAAAMDVLRKRSRGRAQLARPIGRGSRGQRISAPPRCRAAPQADMMTMTRPSSQRVRRRTSRSRRGDDYPAAWRRVDDRGLPERSRHPGPGVAPQSRDPDRTSGPADRL